MHIYHGFIILFITSIVTTNTVQANEYLEKTKAKSLIDLACTTDQIARFNGAKWVCESGLTESVIFNSSIDLENGSVAVGSPASGCITEGDIEFSLQGDGKVGSVGGGVFHDSGPVCKTKLKCTVERRLTIHGWITVPSSCVMKYCCFSETLAKWACI